MNMTATDVGPAVEPRCEWEDLRNPVDFMNSTRCPRPGRSQERTLSPGQTVERTYCDHHWKLSDAIAATSGLKRELVEAAHRWASGSGDAAEVRRLATDHLAAEGLLRRHGWRP